jgi:hypothetical protein
MAEHEVMWIGRRPAAMATKEHPATTEDFAAAITDACAACGCEVEDYLAAAGLYGSFLVRFRRQDVRQRLVWNGKEGQLVLEQATTGPEWATLASSPVTERTTSGFATALEQLLTREPPHAAQA